MLPSTDTLKEPSEAPLPVGNGTRNATGPVGDRDTAPLHWVGECGMKAVT